MPIQVETRDCAALTDADLDEMASMGGAFDIGVLSKAKEDWVLCTTARLDDKLHGCTFSTLERIGGTPCVLVGLMSVKRTSKRDQVLKGLMGEAFHRALMAFPDEDVVIGSRFVTVRGRVVKRDDVRVGFMALDVNIIEGLDTGSSASLRLKVPSTSLNELKIHQIRKILRDHPGDSPVYLHIGHGKILRLADEFCVDLDRAVGELRMLLGHDAVML